MLADVAERLHLEQARDEQIALDVVFVVDLRPRGREQGLRLQREQRRRDDEELGRDLEVGALHAVDVGEVVLGQPRDRDVADVDALVADQRQQELERTLEDLELDLIGVRHLRRG